MTGVGDVVNLKLTNHFSKNDFTDQLAAAKRNRKFCDILLFVEGGLKDETTAIYAHKIIISSVSPYFRRLLNSRTNEKAMMELTVPGINKETLESLIEYMYNCKGTLNEENMFDMYLGAQLFELEEVQFACEKFMGMMKQYYNCIKIWDFAGIHKIENLLDISYIIRNIHSVYDTEDFLKLCFPKVKVIISKVREFYTFEDGLTCITKWINYDSVARVQYLQNLKQSLNDQNVECQLNFSYESFSDFKQKKRRTSSNNVSEDDDLFISFEAVRHSEFPTKRSTSSSSVFSFNEESPPLIYCEQEQNSGNDSNSTTTNGMENSFREEDHSYHNISPVSSSNESFTPTNSSNKQTMKMKRPNHQSSSSLQAKTSKKSQTSNGENSSSPVDPSKLIYCTCRQVSFGPMVACDNADCPYEWFHFDCVGLKSSPAAAEKWYCSLCTIINNRKVNNGKKRSRTQK